MHIAHTTTAIASAAALAAAATAGIDSVVITSGDADARGMLIGAPDSVGKNDFNDLNLRVFDELQNITLENDLILGDRTITAGTTVDAHGVFWDPKRSATVFADIDFTGAILGVATTRDELRLTDAFAALDGVNYRNPRLRGLERRDTYSFVDDVLSIDFRASSPGDFARVFTVSVPSPGPALAMAAAGLAVTRRRR